MIRTRCPILAAASFPLPSLLCHPLSNSGGRFLSGKYVELHRQHQTQLFSSVTSPQLVLWIKWLWWTQRSPPSPQFPHQRLSNTRSTLTLPDRFHIWTPGGLLWFPDRINMLPPPRRRSSTTAPGRVLINPTSKCQQASQVKSLHQGGELLFKWSTCTIFLFISNSISFPTPLTLACLV